MKKLSLDFDMAIKTDCQMFYKTSIVSTFPDLSPWLLQHCNNIYFTDYCSVVYGSCGQRYDPIRYFEPVLSIIPGDENCLNSESLLKEYIKNQIEQGVYLLIECDLIGENASSLGEVEKADECLIFGIDDVNGRVCIPFLDKGRWTEKTIDINDLYVRTKKFREKRETGQYCKKYMQYPVTLIEVKKNTSIALDYHSFCKDVYLRYQHKDLTISFSDGLCVWDGYNACLKGIIWILEKLIKKEIYINNQNKALGLQFKKIWEYRERLLKQEKILLDNFEFDIHSMLQEKNQKCVNMLHMAYLTAIKYTLSGEEAFFYKLRNVYSELWELEEQWVEYLYRSI